MIMNIDRYEALSRNDELKLTPEEIAEGWHFCDEFDGLLVGPQMGELAACLCWPKEHPVYKTIPLEATSDFGGTHV